MTIGSDVTAEPEGQWSDPWRESAQVAEECARLLRGRRLGRLLDAGGGEGFLTTYLMNRGRNRQPILDTSDCDATVLDQSEDLLAEVPAPIRTKRGQLEELGGTDGEFTTILLRQVLHYVRSPELALRTLVHRLRPDGALYVGQIVASDAGTANWLANAANWVSTTRRRVWTVDCLLRTLVQAGVHLEQATLLSHWQELGSGDLVQPPNGVSPPLMNQGGTWVCRVHWLHVLLTAMPCANGPAG